MEQRETRVRYHALDVLRGFCLILMLLHHTLFDIQDLGWAPLTWLDSGWFKVVQTFFASCFVALAGASCNFSRNNLRRAVQFILVALLITAVTAIVTPRLAIWFGIVHLMGGATLLYSLVGKWLDKVPVFVWPILFALTWQLPKTYTQIEGLWWLGIRTVHFSSGDYYPMMPWFFMYMLGVWLGKQIKSNRLPNRFYRLRCPALEAISRHSLVLFVLHQPVILGLLTLADRLFFN